MIVFRRTGTAIRECDVMLSFIGNPSCDNTVKGNTLRHFTPQAGAAEDGKPVCGELRTMRTAIKKACRHVIPKKIPNFAMKPTRSGRIPARIHTREPDRHTVSVATRLHSRIYNHHDGKL